MRKAIEKSLSISALIFVVGLSACVFAQAIGSWHYNNYVITSMQESREYANTLAAKAIFSASVVSFLVGAGLSTIANMKEVADLKRRNRGLTQIVHGESAAIFDKEFYAKYDSHPRN